MLTGMGFGRATRTSVASFIMHSDQDADSGVPGPPAASWQGNGDGDPCAWVQANLAAYADDEVDPKQHNSISDHLHLCGRCATDLNKLIQIDSIIQREWQQDVPLPSSLEHKQGVERIMAALPDEPVTQVRFAARRVHARMRWTRLAAGVAGMALLAGLASLSYRLGQSSQPRPSSPSEIRNLRTPPQRPASTTHLPSGTSSLASRP
jgi:anti-sigma factor RsiW